MDYDAGEESTDRQEERRNLRDAVESGDLEAVNKLLDIGLNVNEEVPDLYNVSGLTVLHLAILKDQLKCVTLLVRRGARIDIVYDVSDLNYSATALELAAQGGKVECLKAILGSLLPEFAPNEYHLSRALYAAVEYWLLEKDRVKTVQLLLDQGTPKDVISKAIIRLVSILNYDDIVGFEFWDHSFEEDQNSNLHTSAGMRRLEILDALLNAGGEINFRHPLEKRYSSTALLVAVYNTVARSPTGAYEFIKSLTDRGANVILPGNGNCGESPLEVAAKSPNHSDINEHLNIVYQKYLQELGNGHKQLPLNELATLQIKYFTDILIAWRKGNPGSETSAIIRDYRDPDGETMILQAARYQNLPVIQALVNDHGLDIDIANNYGVTR